jgi:hypothetical protein
MHVGRSPMIRIRLAASELSAASEILQIFEEIKRMFLSPRFVS